MKVKLLVQPCVQPSQSGSPPSSCCLPRCHFHRRWRYRLLRAHSHRLAVAAVFVVSSSSPPSPLCSRRCWLATTQPSWTRMLRSPLQSACIIILFASSSLLLRPLVVSAVGPADAIVVVALSQSSLSLPSLPPPSENCSFVGGGCRIREEELEQDERVHLHSASEFRVLMRSLHSFVPLQMCGFDGSKNGCFAHKSTPPISANMLPCFRCRSIP